MNKKRPHTAAFFIYHIQCIRLYVSAVAARHLMGIGI